MKYKWGKMNANMWGMVIFSAVFALVYKFSLWYAAQLGEVPSFVFGFERDIPFLPWTIIPYLSSGVFFCVVFLLIKSPETLRVFLKRVLLMTVLAGIGFILMPLQFSQPKPEVSHTILGALFWLLDGVDDPYNQSPSLHVAFAFAFWTVFRELKSPWRHIAAVWLMMVALSTLTTYQHHLIDVFTGSILAHVVFLIIPSQPRTFAYRNLHIANFYFLAAWLVLLTSFLMAEYFGTGWFNGCWLSVALFITGFLCQKYRIGQLRREVIRISVFRRFL